MRIAFRLLLTSMCVGLLAGILVAVSLFLSLSALGAVSAGYAEHLGEMGLTVVVYSVPLGLLGGLTALPGLRRRNTLPRDRWAGRGALLGVSVGAIGSGLVPLLWGDIDGAAFVAFPGGLAGALAGSVTGALLSRTLKLEPTDLSQA